MFSVVAAWGRDFYWHLYLWVDDCKTTAAQISAFQFCWLCVQIPPGRSPIAHCPSKIPKFWDSTNILPAASCSLLFAQRILHFYHFKAISLVELIDETNLELLSSTDESNNPQPSQPQTHALTYFSHWTSRIFNLRHYSHQPHFVYLKNWMNEWTVPRIQHNSLFSHDLVTTFTTLQTSDTVSVS